ncbi:MAG: single-stranded-DNA-specific exonuclease RecJ [Magnetococcales bacterium]|nr:single-stranded-DNA-specific exonuclease RecJ [Magnetococcales bacterium]NGZ26116.1 single-stranded-DNA-specific exonuclease RecJ [Magnetococcales bacterium]
MRELGEKRSLTGKIWRWRAEETPSYQAITRQLGLDTALAPLLAGRSLDSPEQVLEFFSPRLQRLADPDALMDMDKAVDRLVRALQENEKIAVFGDYDVDGATSSALLFHYFRSLGVTLRVYIPDRLTEGYGPSPAAMEQLAKEGIGLIITVDCGISAFQALQSAGQLGMDVIVTDHHQPSVDGLPEAWAVINPNRLDDTFPHKELAGVGVAFYLVMALNRRLRSMEWFEGEIQEPDLKNLLDLVALGTISDLAKLVGLNRVLVHAGMKVASQTDKPGLQALYRLAGVPAEQDIWGLGVDQIGFQVGPRINAGGRLDRGSLGYELLAGQDSQRVEEIAQILDASNRERREIEKTILDEAMAIVQQRNLAETRMGLVVAGENWHPGVVGIVASRLVEKFHRPAIVAAVDREGKAKASGRSIPGVDLLGTIQTLHGMLLNFGGHRAAVGLSMAAERLEEFAIAFDARLRHTYPAETFWPLLTVDSEISLAQADRRLVEHIQRFQPFGMGNPEPIFVLHGVKVSFTRLLNERHVKCVLTDEMGHRLEAIAFRCWPGLLGEGLLKSGSTLDVAGVISLNRFRGEERIQMVIKDARLG